MDDPEEDWLRLSVDRSAFFAAEERVGMRFSMDGEKFTHDAEHGPVWKYLAAVNLDTIVQSPTVVFFDLKRQNFNNDAFCYVGQIADGRTGFVLLGFAVLHKDEMFFTDWTRRLEDRRKPGYPLNWRTDFGSIVWPKQTRA